MRSPRNELLRRARQHARDVATAPLLGGFRRSGKVVEVRIDDDQAADLIASLPDATGSERTAILDRLARAGIFEAIPSTPSESRCEALPIFHGSDAYFEPGPCGLVAGDPSVSGPDGTIPSEPTSIPTPPPSAPLEGSPPAGAVVEAFSSAAASAPSPTSPHAACAPAGAQDVGVTLPSAPNGVGSGTSTPPGPAADAGVAVCDPTANAEQTAPPRTRKPRSDKGRKRGPKITATPEVSGTVAPDAVQGEVGSVTAEPVTSNHYAGGLPGSILDRASKGDLAAQADLAKLEAWLTDEEFERAPLAAEALPITTAAAFAEDMGALQADLEAMPVAEAVATSISDDATAERIIARILDREAQRKRIAIQAEAMDRELANDIRGLAWRFGIPLEEWARRNLRGKARSHKTLLGTAGFAKIAARWSVEDARAVEAWALAQDDPEKFGRYGFALEPAAVLAYAKATGEAIPGLKLSAERETFYLKGDVRVDVTKARSAPALPEPGNPEEE